MLKTGGGVGDIDRPSDRALNVWGVYGGVECRLRRRSGPNVNGKVGCYEPGMCVTYSASRIGRRVQADFTAYNSSSEYCKHWVLGHHFPT